MYIHFCLYNIIYTHSTFCQKNNNFNFRLNLSTFTSNEQNNSKVGQLLTVTS